MLETPSEDKLLQYYTIEVFYRTIITPVKTPQVSAYFSHQCMGQNSPTFRGSGHSRTPVKLIRQNKFHDSKPNLELSENCIKGAGNENQVVITDAQLSLDHWGPTALLAASL